MVDSERGVGRPERALELGRSVPREKLSVASQVALAIAMSGARLDLGQPELALGELQISQLDPSVAYSWSPDLFHAYAEVLEELGRTEEAASWRTRAHVAEDALAEAQHAGEDETIVVIEEDVNDGPVEINDGELARAETLDAIGSVEATERESTETDHISAPVAEEEENDGAASTEN
jgi:hypothetical protein